MNLHFMLPLLALFTLGLAPEDTEPRLIQRDKQPYVAIRTTVTLKDYGTKAPPLWPEVVKWLAARGMKPSGPPLARYVVVDMPKEMQLEIGFPVSKAVKGDKRVISGFLPAGKYVEVVHKGDYSGMIPANAALQEWAQKQGLQWKMSGNTWIGRVEFNRVDPGDTTDSSKWETQILYLVK